MYWVCINQVIMCKFVKIQMIFLKLDRFEAENYITFSQSIIIVIVTTIFCVNQVGTITIIPYLQFLREGVSMQLHWWISKCLFKYNFVKIAKWNVHKMAT